MCCNSEYTFLLNLMVGKTISLKSKTFRPFRHSSNFALACENTNKNINKILKLFRWNVFLKWTNFFCHFFVFFFYGLSADCSTVSWSSVNPSQSSAVLGWVVFFSWFHTELCFCCCHLRYSLILCTILIYLLDLKCFI